MILKLLLAGSLFLLSSCAPKEMIEWKVANSAPCGPSSCGKLPSSNEQ